MAENAIISDLEFAPQLTDDMVFAVEDTQNTYSSTLGMLRGQLNKIFVERKDVDFNTLTDDGFYQVSGTLTNAPVAGSITWLVQVVKDASTIVQIVFGLDTANYLRNFARRWNGSTWTSWDVIGGKIIQSLSSSTTDIPSSKAVQDAVNSKQGTITGGATTIVSNNLTAGRALISDSNGKVAVSGVSSAELGYLDGVTSSIQTQLNARANTSLSNVTTAGLSSGYFYIGKLLIQWGNTWSSRNTDVTQNLPKPYANTSYYVAACSTNLSPVTYNDGVIFVKNKTTTSFVHNGFCDNKTLNWITIGQGA